MIEEPDDTQRRQVLALLAQHGLSPDDGEIDALVAAYPTFRMIAGAAFAVPGVRYAEPATTFAAGADHG